MFEFENKKNLINGALITIGSLTLFLLASTYNVLNQNKSDVNQPTITVTGEGEYFAIPDTANFNFTVSKDGSTQKIAQDSGSEIMNTILKSLKTYFNLDDKDLKTTSFSVNPKYEYNNPRPCFGGICPGYETVSSSPKIVGYTFSQSVNVKIKDLEKAGNVAAKLAELGATNVYGPDFTLANEDIAQDTAREMAINDAKEKAQILAKQLGVRLGKIQSFSDSNNGGVYPVMYNSMKMESASDAGGVAPELPTGENKYTSNVSITYKIK